MNYAIPVPPGCERRARARGPSPTGVVVGDAARLPTPSAELGGIHDGSMGWVLASEPWVERSPEEGACAVRGPFQ